MFVHELIVGVVVALVTGAGAWMLRQSAPLFGRALDVARTYIRGGGESTMAYEKQYAIRDELNARYPRIKSNFGQQAFRSGYNMSRLHGETPEEARRTSINAVRATIDATFTPIENPA
jgi:hypothetical protein